MAFTFNKETRRSLRERIRDGIGTVVQAPANILGVGGGGGSGGGGSGEGIMGKGGGPSTLHQQKKSHSVDSTVLQETAEESINARRQGGSACQLTNANVMTTGGTAAAGAVSLLSSGGGSSGGPSSMASSASSLPPPSPTYLTAESSSNTPGSGGGGGDHDGSSRSGSVSSCSSSNSSSPSKYRTYVVKTNDTVTSIAASFDCTPTELMRVNRLITARVLFPGQVLKIPHKRTTSTSGQPPQAPSISDSSSSAESQVHHHNIQNLPGHPHHHHHHDPATANILESITYAQRKFLKIKVRHVTDGNGVVSGTLLITPNAVMFDPNVSDPLVIEQGAEMYGIIVPIEYIVGASIWSDICGMRVRGKEAFIPPGPRPVLWGVDFASGGGSAGTTLSLSEQQQGRGTPTVLEEQVGDGDASETKAEEEKKGDDGGAAAEVVGAEGTGDGGGGGGDKVEDEETSTDECQKQKSVEVEEESHNSNNNNNDSNNHHSNNNGNESPSNSSSNNNGNNRLESVTDHPLKDESSSSSSSNTTVTSVTPESTVATWYFCLTIGRPKPQDGGGGGGGGDQQVNRARRNPFCVTYGQKNTVRPEFWFSVGKEQVPELFKYWMFWWPHLYGDIDLKIVSDRGFQLIDWDNLDVAGWRLDSTPGGVGVVGVGGVGGNGGAPGAPRPRTSNEEGSEEQSMAQELNDLTKESWEMLKQPYAKLSSFITTRGSSIMKSSSHSSQSSVSDGMATGGGGGEGGGTGGDLGVGGGSGGSHSSHGGHHRHGHHQQHGGSGSTSIFNSHHFSITNPMNSFFFESFSNISPNHSVFDDTDDDDEFGSFEQVVTNEELRNLLAIGGDEMMTIVPDLIGGKSEILEEEDIRNLTRHLTARAEGYPWTQIFNSSRDGFSLNSLYRRNSQMQEDSPVILVVQDTNARVFGALVSCSLHTSDSFYGTGQSFLFTLRPEFNVFKWTGENLFFVKGNHDGIWIGAGDGKFGLYVDGDLNCGRTEPCQTYGNASLTEPQDFIIKTLECWAFGNYVLDV